MIITKNFFYIETPHRARTMFRCDWLNSLLAIFVAKLTLLVSSGKVSSFGRLLFFDSVTEFYRFVTNQCSRNSVYPSCPCLKKLSSLLEISFKTSCRQVKLCNVTVISLRYGFPLNRIKLFTFSTTSLNYLERLPNKPLLQNIFIVFPEWVSSVKQLLIVRSLWYTSFHSVI